MCQYKNTLFCTLGFFPNKYRDQDITHHLVIVKSQYHEILSHKWQKPPTYNTSLIPPIFHAISLINFMSFLPDAVTQPHPLSRHPVHLPRRTCHSWCTSSRYFPRALRAYVCPLVPGTRTLRRSPRTWRWASCSCGTPAIITISIHHITLSIHHITLSIHHNTLSIDDRYRWYHMTGIDNITWQVSIISHDRYR